MKDYMKGQIMEQGVPFVMTLVFIGILMGAGAIAISAMLSTWQAGNPNYANAYTNGTLGNTMNNSNLGIGNFTAQMPTVGTIAGVGLIILVLFVAIGAYIFTKR